MCQKYFATFREREFQSQNRSSRLLGAVGYERIDGQCHVCAVCSVTLVGFARFDAGAAARKKDR